MGTLIFIGAVIFLLAGFTYVIQFLLFVGRVIWLLGSLLGSLLAILLFAVVDPKKAAEIWRKAKHQ